MNVVATDCGVVEVQGTGESGPFSREQLNELIDAGIDAEKVEDMYTEAHSQIRSDPFKAGKAKAKGITWTRKGNKVTSSDGKEVNRSVKLSMRQRKAKVAAKIAKWFLLLVVHDLGLVLLCLWVFNQRDSNKEPWKWLGFTEDGV